MSTAKGLLLLNVHNVLYTIVEAAEHVIPYDKFTGRRNGDTWNVEWTLCKMQTSGQTDA